MAQVRTLITLIMFGLAAGDVQAQPLESTPRASHASIQAHLNFLANDFMKGRDTGSAEYEIAARYVAAQFQSLGLEPAGDDGTYFATFSLTLERQLTDASRLVFSGDGEPRRLNVDFVPFSFSSNDEFNGGITFCGYGIVNPEKEWDGCAMISVAEWPY